MDTDKTSQNIPHEKNRVYQNCNSGNCKSHFWAPGQDNSLEKKHRIDLRSSRRSHLHSRCCESHLCKGTHHQRTRWSIVVQILLTFGPRNSWPWSDGVTPYIAYLRIARLRTSFLSSSTLISPSLAFLHFLNYGCDPYLSYFQNKQSIAGKDETKSTLLMDIFWSLVAHFPSEN